MLPFDDSNIDDPEEITIDDLPNSSVITDNTANNENDNNTVNTDANNTTKPKRGRPPKIHPTSQLKRNNNGIRAAKVDTDPLIYYPIDKILDASYVNNKLRVRVRYEDFETRWVPITLLNDKAKRMFDSMKLKPRHVPALRTRSK